MYNRRVLAGEFAVVNKHLLRDLTQRGLWTAAVRNQIIADQGSVQRLEIPQDLKVKSWSHGIMKDTRCCKTQNCWVVPSKLHDNELKILLKF